MCPCVPLFILSSVRQSIHTLFASLAERASCVFLAVLVFDAFGVISFLCVCCVFVVVCVCVCFLIIVRCVCVSSDSCSSRICHVLCSCHCHPLLMFCSFVLILLNIFFKMCVDTCGRSFIHSFIRSSINPYNLCFMHSFIHSFVHSFVHSFIHSFIHAFQFVSFRFCSLHVRPCRAILCRLVLLHFI